MTTRAPARWSGSTAIVPPWRVDDVAGDRQAEPGTAGAAVRASSSRVNRSKIRSRCVVGDARAVVGDGHGRGAVALGDCELHDARGVARGVVDDVADRRGRAASRSP